MGRMRKIQNEDKQNKNTTQKTENYKWATRTHKIKPGVVPGAQEV
jgi:hypothetical protein